MEKAPRFKVVMADLDVVDTSANTISGGLLRCVIVDVPDYESGIVRNIVIREDDYAFWTTIPVRRHLKPCCCRCFSPGIGKSTVAFAIRLLLKRNKTLVYKYRTMDNTSHYVQFIPATASSIAGASAADDNPGDIPHEQVEIDLFLEDNTKTNEIPSLLNPETYYVVDPGKAKDNGKPGPSVDCRVIIVASSDERHWGEMSSFMKDNQTGLGGEIVQYFPDWSVPQLEAASTLLLSKDQDQVDIVAKLYSIIGGIPRLMFAPKQRKARNRRQLKRKVESIQFRPKNCGTC